MESTLLVKIILLMILKTYLFQKLVHFSRKKGVNLVTPKLARLFVRALNQQILQNSVIGKNISFSDFKNSLLDSLQTVERHLEKTSYSLILPNASPPQRGCEVYHNESYIKSYWLEIF